MLKKVKNNKIYKMWKIYLKIRSKFLKIDKLTFIIILILSNNNNMD